MRIISPEVVYLEGIMPNYPAGSQIPKLDQDEVTLYKIRYSKNLIKANEQRQSKLLDLVDYEPWEGGKYVLMDGSEALDSDNEPASVTKRYPDTSWSQAKYFQRRISCIEKNWAHPVHPKDAKRIMMDPQSRLIDLAISAHNRQYDDEIFDALDGSAKEIYTDTNNTEQESDVAVPSAQVKQYNDASEGIIFDALEILMDLDVDLDNDMVNFAFPPRIWRKLMDKEAVRSSLYTQEYSLETRELPKFGMVNFMMSTRCKGVKRGATWYWRCPLWVKSTCAFSGFTQPIIDFGPRRDKTIALQLQTWAEFGAARRQENIVLLEVKDPSAANAKRTVEIAA